MNGLSNKQQTKEVALEYVRKYGFSVIPVSPNKKPRIEWAEFQKRLATEDEIRKWFTKYPECGIGIVTGKLSNLAVLDIDTQETPQELKDLFNLKKSIPRVSTPRGSHYYFNYREGITNTVNINGKKMDIRGEGGYVVAPPSNNGEKEYRWKIPLDNGRSEFPEELLPITQEYEQGESIKRDVKFSQGNRDESLFHAANSLARGGMPEDEIRPIISQLATTCDPPFSEKEAQEKVDSAIKRALKRDIPIADGTAEMRKRIAEWAKEEIYPGQAFHIRDAYPVVNASTADERKAVSNELRYLIDTGFLERPLNSSYGNFKRIDNTVLAVDYKNANPKRFDIKLPLDLDDLITLSPSDMVVVAGEGGAGKTSFALDLLKRNKDSLDCLYLSSELTGGKMKQRLMFHEDMTLNDWTFRMVSREHDFASAIEPDKINVVDFIVTTDEFWKAAIALREIHNKMIGGKGLCFVFLQKGKHKEFGYGGDLTQIHASLYLTISKGNPNFLKFVKVREFKNKLVNGVPNNPLGKVIPFKLINSWKFQPLSAEPVYQEDYEVMNKDKKQW